jgi:cytochrome c2
MNNYTLNLKCNNCMQTFTQRVKVGTSVNTDGAGTLTYNENGQKILVMCPKCHTFDKITRV